jgi:hypothetical protein
MQQKNDGSAKQALRRAFRRGTRTGSRQSGPPGLCGMA